MGSIVPKKYKEPLTSKELMLIMKKQGDSLNRPVAKPSDVRM